MLNELTSIDIKDKNDYIVNFENLHKVAHLGNMTSLNEKMNFVKEIMSKEQDYEGEVLLFNYAKNFYLTVSIISHFLTLVNVISKIIPHLLLTAIKVGDF